MMNKQEKLDLAVNCNDQIADLTKKVDAFFGISKDEIITDISVGDLERICVRLLEAIPHIDNDKANSSLQQIVRQLKLKIKMTMKEME